MYNGFIFDEKGVFYILTAFSSFTKNDSINFELKNFKSLIMLEKCSKNFIFSWHFLPPTKYFHELPEIT